jgi:hypothetical protein
MGDETPSNDARLEAIRTHADETMRYYATAFLQEENVEHREWMRAYLSITANFIALAEGDRLDDRGMLTGRDEIVQAYLERAESDPYEPGNCSFCGARPPVAWFEGPTFRTFVRSSAEVHAEEAWLACATCLELVEADDREGLVMRGAGRGVRSGREIPQDQAESLARRMQVELFWRLRDQL